MHGVDATKKRARRLTAERRVCVAWRMSQAERDLLYTSAKVLGVSQSAALRQAVRAFAARTLVAATEDGAARV